MLHKNIVSEKDCNEIVSWWKEQKPLYEYRMIVKGAWYIKGDGALCEPIQRIGDKVKERIELDRGDVQLTELKYSCVRKYLKGNNLNKHLDTAADLSVSIHIKQSDDKINPLIVYNKDNKDVFEMRDGDGCSFWGMKQYHERPEIQSEYLIHLYLGYNYLYRNETKKSMI